MKVRPPLPDVLEPAVAPSPRRDGARGAGAQKLLAEVHRDGRPQWCAAVGFSRVRLADGINVIRFAIAHDQIALCPSGSELVVIGPGRLRTIELGRARGAAGWRCTRPRTSRRSRLVQTWLAALAERAMRRDRWPPEAAARCGDAAI
jgi:hypothetical protein